MNAAKLPRRRRLLVYTVSAGLWLSGIAWLVAHYLLMREGEFGPETSAFEPWSLKLHGAFAMAALWSAGLLWGVHVVHGWRARRGRWSGGALLGLLLFLAVSGYLLYYLSDDDLRGWTSLAHWIVGASVLVVFLWHRFGRKRARPPRRSGTSVT